MTDFEAELRRALKRREPPGDLTGAVMARIAPPRRIGPWRPMLAAAAAAGMVLAVGLHRLDDYRKAQKARQQVILALEITAQKLAVAQEKIDELNRRRIGHER